MKLAYALLVTLADGRFHSGTEMGERNGRTRAAVWKAIQSLQANGLEIFSVRGKGYRLAQPIELLNRGIILDGLDKRASAALNVLEVFNEIDSTNAYLLEIAKQGEATGYACLAEQQRAGRGRRGRQWVSPHGGNIYLSLLWRFTGGVSQLGGLSLAMGVALRRALSEVGLNEAQLKWPNDILVGKRKLAGILLEMTGDASGPCAVVMGIGLNVRSSPAHMLTVEQDWVDLQDLLPEAIPRNHLVSRLLSQMISVLEDFERHGFSHFQSEWNAGDAFAKQTVELHLPDRRIEGMAQGVDHSGALLLERDGKLERFHSGEVSLRGRA